MKRNMMIAAVRYDESDGISKKICMQAAGLSGPEVEVDLLCIGHDGTGIVLINFINRMQQSKKELLDKQVKTEGIGGINEIKTLLTVAQMRIKKIPYNIVYIRHMLPCHRLIGLLYSLKNRGMKIGYEIPTYPYYKEQMGISRNKAKTMIKLIYESIYWPMIYCFIDKLFVVRCSSRSLHLKKMCDIVNGFSGTRNLQARGQIIDLNLIGVGTIYTYHGYDRIINAMIKSNAKLKDGRNIYFHVVGESTEIERLHNIIQTEGINIRQNVIFHGKQYKETLQKLYLQSNLGVGTLALSIRNANIDTAIKNLEYWSFGLPVITSGRIFNVDEESGLYFKQSEKDSIDFEKIAEFVSKFYDTHGMYRKIDNLLNDFTWNSIMHKVVIEMEK